MNTQNTNGMENGYEYVDFGLRSGLLWATCNVGAKSPEQAGLYFAWGETTGFTAEQVRSGERRFDHKSYLNQNISSKLLPEQDVAHVNMGGKWRLPTEEEFYELLLASDISVTKRNNGDHLEVCKVLTSIINGNTITLPVAGYALGQDIFYKNERMCFRYSDLGFYDAKFERYIYGYSVRAVCEK